MRKNFRLTTQDQMKYREALQLLVGTPLEGDVVTAVKLGLTQAMGGRAVVQPKNLADAIYEFLRSNKKLRESTQDYYRRNLEWLSDQLEPDPMNPVKVGEIRALQIHDLLTGLDVKPTSINSRWRAIRAFMRWCTERGYSSEPWEKADPNVEDEAPRDFFPVEEVERLLKESGKYRYTYLLGFFAGIRQHEIRGDHKPPLRFESVNVEERYIRISDEINKDGRKRGARIIQKLPDRFWAEWSGAPREGDICPHSIIASVDHGIKVLGYWKKNGPRHTFTTYHIAAFGSPGLTAAILGHDTKLSTLNRHYKGNETRFEGKVYVATEARGKAYFNVL